MGFLCHFKPLSSFTPQCSKSLFSKSGQCGINAKRLLRVSTCSCSLNIDHPFKGISNLCSKCGPAVDLALVGMPSIILSVQELDVPQIQSIQTAGHMSFLLAFSYFARSAFLWICMAGHAWTALNFEVNSLVSRDRERPHPLALVPTWASQDPAGRHSPRLDPWRQQLVLLLL